MKNTYNGDTLLNWQSDPLLLDKTPTSWQQWITANDIVKSDSASPSSQLFLKDHFLNFYGIMIRKYDFVKQTHRDRLLTRFPYINLTESLHKAMNDKYHQLGWKLSQYFRDAERFGPIEGRKKLDRYRQQGRLPLPFFRVLSNLQGNEFDFLMEHFRNANLESFRHEPFIFPTQLTTNLAYFLGACAGDGTLNPYQIRIIDGHNAYMKCLHTLTCRFTQSNVELRDVKEAKAWLLILKSKWYARLVHFLTGQPFGKKYDSLLVPTVFRKFSNRKELENRYCQGLFDTDGGVDEKARIPYLCITSKRLVNGIARILQDRRINHSLYWNGKRVWNLQIKRAGLKRFAREIGFISPSKQEALFKSLETEPAHTEFLGINPKSIINESNHFNFRLLPKLLVVNSYSFFDRIMSQIRREKMKNIGAGDPQQRKKWSRSTRVPFDVLEKATSTLGMDIYEELDKKRVHFSYPYSKYSVRIASSITDQLIDVMTYLTPFPRGLLAITGQFRNTPKKQVTDVVKRASECFEIPSSRFQRNNDHSYKIFNELLRDYAKTYFRYEKPWKTINKKERRALLTNWHELLEEKLFR